MVAISGNLGNLPLVIDRCKLSGRKASFHQYLNCRQRMPELRNVKLTEGIITYHPGKYRARLHYSLGKNQAIAEVEARANPNMTCSFLFEIFRIDVLEHDLGSSMMPLQTY